MPSSDYVQYGCGWCAPRSWRNFDASPTLRFERVPVLGRLYTKNDTRFPDNVEYGDIVRGLPVPPHSAKGVYCSHVLEHLPLEDFRSALQNTLRIMTLGGVFRFVVPDLEIAANRYVVDPSDAAASNFMRSTGLGRERRPRGSWELVKAALGNSEHMWMWDYKSLAHELRQAGFVDIRRAQFGSAEDPMFSAVEQEGRWTDSIGIECRRPAHGS
jgi:hypothetical protein